MRNVVLVAVLSFSMPLASQEVVRPVIAVGDLTLLTAAQRGWLTAFENDAKTHTAEGTDPVAAAAWLERSSAGARDAGLRTTADYLVTAARALSGERTIEDLERAWRATLHESLLVIVRLDGSRISEVTVCTCDPARASEVDASIERFERTLPGFRMAWLDRSPTRTITRIANLHFRAGRNANVASNGTYLPFDRAMTAAVGRTWVVHENMIRASWWAEAMRPAALRLLVNGSEKATPEALVAWYGRRAPMYDIGPHYTPAEREKLGANKDPISIMKGDLFPVLLAGADEGSIATLAAISLHTLREAKNGNAPAPHRPASAAEINWLVDRGGLRFDEETVTWRIDLEKCRAAVRDLAAEVMAMEASDDGKRAEAFFANYGASSPAIEKTVQTLDTLPRIKVQTIFAR